MFLSWIDIVDEMMNHRRTTIVNRLYVGLFVCIGLLLYIHYGVSPPAQQHHESFDLVPTMDFYVITMGQSDRETNIQSQIKRQMEHMRANSDVFRFTIHKIDAVVGQELDVDQLVDQGRVFPEIYDNPVHQDNGRFSGNSFNEKWANRKNEVGCYLSHYKTYETIRDHGDPQGYSVIFEDDFALDPDFMRILDETMVKLMADKGTDFDMLFLGITGDRGAHVLDNVYQTTGISFCAHGYLINNRNIDHILDEMKYIDNIVDVQIFKKANAGTLRVLRLDPTIVEQGDLGTGIRNH
jgi:GR25 family glycosyltransferase involved in LPS biosynthesis